MPVVRMRIEHRVAKGMGARLVVEGVPFPLDEVNAIVHVR